MNGARTHSSSALQVPLLFIASIWTILRSSKLLLLSIIPATIGIVSFFAIFVTSLVMRREITELIVTTQHWWSDALSVIGVALVGLLSASIGAFVLTNLLAVFTLESIAKEVLLRESVAVREIPITVGEILKTLLETAVRCLYLLVLGAITLFCSFVPVLAIIPLVIGSLIVGADLLDTPLTLQGLRFNEKVVVIKKNILHVLVLGGCFSFVLLLPFIGTLFLPLGVVCAAKVAARITPEAGSLGNSQKLA